MSHLTHEPCGYIDGNAYYLGLAHLGPVCDKLGVSSEQFLAEKAEPSFDNRHPFFWLNPKTQKYESFPDRESLIKALALPEHVPLYIQGYMRPERPSNPHRRDNPHRKRK